MKVVVESHDSYVELYLKKPRKIEIIEVEVYAESFGMMEDELIDYLKARGSCLAKFLEVEYQYADNRS
jgi:hypothetical protein